MGEPLQIGIGSGERTDRVSGTPAAAPLPCLSSNNCTKRLHSLTNQAKKTADLLRRSIEKMVKNHGIERLGFFTLTFAELISDPKESQKRYHSLRSHVLKERYGDIIRVFERHKSGRIHYHLVVSVPFDIRQGFDWEYYDVLQAWQRHGRLGIKPPGVLTTNDFLRDEWAFWLECAPKYGFGRTELTPIRSNEEAISKYVGKYISKHFEHRLVEDKGVRLVEFTKGARDGTTRFAWVSAVNWLWREKVKAWALSEGLKSEEQVLAVFGKHWAWRCRKRIMAFPLDYWPSMIHVMADETGPDPVSSFIPEESGKIVRWFEGKRQWQMEAHCNPGWEDFPGIIAPKGRQFKLKSLPRVSDETVIEDLMVRQGIPYWLRLSPLEKESYLEECERRRDRVDPERKYRRSHGVYGED